MEAAKPSLYGLLASLAVVLPSLTIVDMRYAKATELHLVNNMLSEYIYEQYEEKIEEIEEKIRSLDSVLSRTPAEELRLQQLKDRKHKYLRKLEKKHG